jgi:hypothetical protein
MKCQEKTPLDYQYTLKKNEGLEGKTGLFWRWVTMGRENKERGNESEYGGCILYSYMKIEQ